MKDIFKSASLKRNVLVVDDEIINREILGYILSRNYIVTYAVDGQEAIELLRDPDHSYSLVLLDLNMPRINGFEFLNIRAQDEMLKKIPVIVMTAEFDAEVSTLRMGAVDFITKPFEMPEVILARCERVIEVAEDRNILKHIEKDPVTGLYTKEMFIEYVRQLTPYITGSMDAVCINIDRFHFINELFGRREGNVILARIADLIDEFILVGDGIACRAEADTFYVFCEHREDYESALSTLQSKLREVSKMNEIHLRAGAYMNVDTEQMAEMWFDWAKISCDRIRGDYTRQVEYYSNAIHERAILHERLISDIQDAINNRHLIVYYQPKYNIEGDEPRLASAEALVRWRHPELGMISPGEFIPLFESNGLIQRLDNFVWREAAAQVRKWKDELGYSLPVSVNISRVDVFDPDLVLKLNSILTDFELDPSEFMLEITETAYSENSSVLIKTIDRLRDIGFKIEMDDFGSGYSSLNMLTTIPIDVLKMDMKFIRNMLKDEKTLKLVELIIDIAEFLGVPVVAEGVEEEKQLIALKEMGCQIIQGYYFSPPVEAEQFEKFIIKEIERKSAE